MQPTAEGQRLRNAGMATAINATEPDDAAPVLLAVDPATGQQINIDDPRIPMEIRLGARMSAALLAEDHDTAVALWHTARTPDAEEQVVLLVLRTMAALIAPNTTVEEARTDD